MKYKPHNTKQATEEVKKNTRQRNEFQLKADIQTIVVEYWKIILWQCVLCVHKWTWLSPSTDRMAQSLHIFDIMDCHKKNKLNTNAVFAFIFYQPDSSSWHYVHPVKRNETNILCNMHIITFSSKSFYFFIYHFRKDILNKNMQIYY